MATVTQLAANQQNSRKSTGPSTIEGKARASQNALRHGLLSDRLLLQDEDASDLQELLYGLTESVRPVGTLEHALVERVAISLWRQRRLIRAETAGLELARNLENAANRQQMEMALGRGLGCPITVEEVLPLTKYDVQSIAHMSNLTQEHDALDDEALSDPDKFAESAPMMYEELRDDAAAEETTIIELLSRFEGGLGEWVKDTMQYYRTEFEALQRRAAVLAVAELVKSHRSAPIEQELLSRYQVSLDNEVYKAIRALREAQEWRMKTIETVGTALAPDDHAVA